LALISRNQLFRSFYEAQPEGKAKFSAWNQAVYEAVVPQEKAKLGEVPEK
jgi:hypothetical protein